METSASWPATAARPYVTGGGTADGTAVSQADWKSAPNQQFKLKGTLLGDAGDGGKSGKAGADGTGGSTGKKKPHKAKPATAAAAP